MPRSRRGQGWRVTLAGLALLLTCGAGGARGAVAQDARPDGSPDAADSATILLDSLLAGTAILQTSEGNLRGDDLRGDDLRGGSADDVAAMVRRPGDAVPVPVLVLRVGDARSVIWLADLTAEKRAAHEGGTVEIVELNGEGPAELVYRGQDAGGASMLWIFGWAGAQSQDGQPPGGQLQKLFEGHSSAGRLDLRDLGDDGQPEIVMEQPGCKTSGGKPTLVFAFRWQDGGYHAATAAYPHLQDAAIAEAAGAANRLGVGLGKPSAEAACLAYVVALAQAYQGHAAEMAQAYR
jgi:hypothetical protein